MHNYYTTRHLLYLPIPPPAPGNALATVILSWQLLFLHPTPLSLLLLFLNSLFSRKDKMKKGDYFPRRYLGCRINCDKKWMDR